MRLRWLMVRPGSIPAVHRNKEDDMEERMSEVLWSINARLEELVEAVRELKPADNAELFPRLKPEDLHGLPHAHQFLNCGKVGWDNPLIICECGEFNPWFTQGTHKGQLNDEEWGGCPGCKDQYSCQCSGCK